MLLYFFWGSCVGRHHAGGIGKRPVFFLKNCTESIIHLIEASSNLVALAQYFIFPLKASRNVSSLWSFRFCWSEAYDAWLAWDLSFYLIWPLLVRWPVTITRDCSMSSGIRKCCTRRTIGTILHDVYLCAAVNYGLGMISCFSSDLVE